uniref:X-prolyl aminopeptidase 2 n=1 Tax=Bubo bubo TaxID=30461 RepID=A0A8C0ECZ4_BUBBB
CLEHNPGCCPGCAAGRPPQDASARTDIRDCSVDPPYLPPTAINTTVQLTALRDIMRAHRVHAYIVPSTDAHMSEYIAERDSRLGWLTGFTGSAGTGVVTQDKAALWTDSRYWTQAERQLDCNWELTPTPLWAVPPHPASFPSLFVDELRLSAAA